MERVAPRTVVIASRNADKVREIRELFAGLPFEIRSAADYPGLPDVIEDGTTLLGNAARKAIVTAAYTGEISVSDDTGLRVEALGGLPDIFAARFDGPGATYASNCELLSELMADAPDDSRGARFLTAVAWVDPRPSLSGLGVDARPGPEGALRWLHNPYRRAVHYGDPVEEAEFWNGLIDRRAVWDQYLAAAEPPSRAPGVDAARLAGIRDRLTESVRHGLRPADADPSHLRLPDTRIWTATGPDDVDEPTHVTPAGLPADAPGHALNEAVWCELSAEGVLAGEIARRPRGAKGFGYDPVFSPLDTDRTLAELSAEEKNALSHRGVALRRLLDAARTAYGPGA